MTPPSEQQILDLQEENHALKKMVDQLHQQEKAHQELLAFVSHEIKTPIGAISAMAELLKNTSLNETQSHYVNTLFFAADSLTLATQDMLNFASLDAGHLSFNPQQIQFGTFLSTLALSIAPQAEAKGITFQAQMANNVPKIITVDPNRLSQVINNLANNALKYTKQGNISLKVGSKPLETGEDEIYIQISDTGIGISQEEQEKIFKPFVQASNAIDKSITGSGLGLWIARKIAAGLNGTLTCTSQQNKGSTFTFSFKSNKQDTASQNSEPKVQEISSPEQAQQVLQEAINTPAKEEPTSQPIPDDKTDKQFSRLEGNVLVVEDNHLNQMLIEVYLEKFGLSFKCVDNGLSALAVTEQEDFDLILMDMMMPILDGPETSKELHRTWEEKQQKKIPIIAFSAITNLENKTSYKEAGMVGFVAKPIDSEALFKVLSQYLPHKDNQPSKLDRAMTA